MCVSRLDGVGASLLTMAYAPRPAIRAGPWCLVPNAYNLVSKLRHLIHHNTEHTLSLSLILLRTQPILQLRQIVSNRRNRPPKHRLPSSTPPASSSLWVRQTLLPHRNQPERLLLLVRRGRRGDSIAACLDNIHLLVLVTADVLDVGTGR